MMNAECRTKTPDPFLAVRFFVLHSAFIILHSFFHTAQPRTNTLCATESSSNFGGSVSSLPCSNRRSRQMEWAVR
jgi:hypothetical protein